MRHEHASDALSGLFGVLGLAGLVWMCVQWIRGEFGAW